MATLVIRDLREDVKARLRIQAAEHGHSMEAEARALLTTALFGRRIEGLGTYIHERFADIGGVDLVTPVRVEPARAVRFGK
jgi:plasmid stability protein